MATSSDPIVYPVTEGDSPTLFRAVTVFNGGTPRLALQSDFTDITFQVFGTSSTGPEVEITSGPVTLNIPDVIDDTPPSTGDLAGMNFSTQVNDFLMRGNRRRRVQVKFTLTGAQTAKRSWILWTEGVPGYTPTGRPPGGIMLATLNQLIAKAKADAADQDVLRRLDAALVRADAWVRRYCRWNLTADDFTEYHDGGRQEIILKQMRVTATTGTSVENDDFDYGVWYDTDRLWPDSSLLVAGTDYRLEDGGANGIVRRLAGGWCSAWGSGWRAGYETTRIRYRAGYEEDEIPDDLAGAVLEVALQMYLKDALSRQAVSTSEQAASAGGAVTRIKRGQSEVSYAAPSAARSSTSTSAGARTGGIPADPYGVNATLDLYRDRRFG